MRIRAMNSAIVASRSARRGAAAELVLECVIAFD
jgi:hypothetical protein